MSATGGVVWGGRLAVDKPRRRTDEEALQRALVQWLRWALPDDATFMAIPNGGQRHSKVAAKLVGQGVRAGAPDLLVVYRGFPLFIELKTPRGALSAAQKQMHQKLAHCGAGVFIARSVEDVANYLLSLGMKLNARLT